MNSLPIEGSIPALLETVRSNRNTLLHAPPGAGKTTRVPVALLSIVPPEAGRIIMLEPRRLATVSAARWMAKCLGEDVGRTVGYSIRFESRISTATRIEVVTEGVLTRRLQNDPTLESVAVVIFDEFHERSIHADLGLALCRDVQQQLRPDLKMLIMSATLDVVPLTRLLDDAPLVSSPGLSFPVEEIYLDDSGHERLPLKMAAAIMRALPETEGDILAFLPGSGEIHTCAQRLAETGRMENILILPLYGDLPFAEQQKVLLPASRRKIVLATSIAETSLTIEGIRVVIDCGMSRRLQFDPSSGMNRLITVRESRASAEQRKGRAGRTSPGVCYRLFSRHTLNAMTPHSPAEICSTDLSPLLLELAAWGVTDLSQLSWLNQPSDTAVTVSRTLLAELDALDEEGRITPAGSELVHLPLHPRLGRLLLRSRELCCLQLGCGLAALLSERDIFLKGLAREEPRSGYDISDRLEALQNWRGGRRDDPRLEQTAARNAERVASQLEMLTGCHFTSYHDVDADLIARLLLAAYPDRVGHRRTPGFNAYLLVNGRGATLSPHCSVRTAEWIIATSLDAGDRADAIIHAAAEVSENIIREERTAHLKWASHVTWNEREGRVIAERRECLGAVTITSETVMPEDDLLVPVVLEAVRASGLTILNMNESVRQLQGRMGLVRSAFPEKSWPDVSDAVLLDTLEAWLAPNCSGVNSARKLGQLDVGVLLKQQLDYRQQTELETLAPSHLTVPSGSRIKLDYVSQVPVLAVKLQELFGLATGPAVCNGRVAVLLHLLSPAGRPLQVTRDLAGFWDGAYLQIKKELKGRYPRHPWPDDPWSAVPTRRTKPKPTS